MGNRVQVCIAFTSALVALAITTIVRLIDRFAVAVSAALILHRHGREAGKSEPLARALGGRVASVPRQEC